MTVCCSGLGKLCIGWTEGRQQIAMLTVTLAAVALGIWAMWKFIRRKRYHLPGPPSLPFFGNVFQLDEECPHGTITDWSDQYGDVMKIKMFGNDLVVLNSFETIYEALVTKATEFGGRPKSFRTDIVWSYCDGVAFTTYSRKWVFLKKATLQALKMYGDNLETLELITLDLIKDMNEELRAAIKTGERVNMRPIIHQCITGIITSIMYGHKVNRSDVTSLLAGQKHIIKAIAPTGLDVLLDIAPILRFVMRKTYGQLVKACGSNQQWIKREIRNRQRLYEAGNPRCVADALFEAQRKCQENNEDLQITADNIYGINLDIILAGTVTTSVSLQCLIAVLVNKPDIQQKMADVIAKELGREEPRLRHREKLAYIEAAILELLRYSSIVPLNLPHCTTTDTVINGYDIPKDTQIMCNLWKLHHSSDYWDEPWEFKPERFLDRDGMLVAPDHINRRRLLPFGASRRVCVGEALAKNRLFLMVTSLMQNFQFLPVSEDKRPSHDPRTYVSGFSVGPKDYLVKLLPRLANVA